MCVCKCGGSEMSSIYFYLSDISRNGRKLEMVVPCCSCIIAPLHRLNRIL